MKAAARRSRLFSLGLLAAGAAALLLLLLLLGLFTVGEGRAGVLLTAAVERLLAWADGQLPFLYLLLFLAPFLPLPVTPFLVTAGIAFTARYGEWAGSALAASAVALNLALVYFPVAGPLRRFVQRFLERSRFAMPAGEQVGGTRLCWVVRLTPVLPLFVQSYLLGILRVPYRSYLLASWTIQVPLAFVVAMSAGAVLEGNWILVLGALAVLAGLLWLRQLGRARVVPEGQEENALP